MNGDLDSPRRLAAIRGWIRQRLPLKVDADLFAEVSAFLGSCYLVGLTLWACHDDHFHTTPYHEQLYAARDEDDLMLWLYERVCRDLAVKLAALAITGAEARRWRYYPVGRKGHRFRYCENALYLYNTVYQPKKATYEYYLALLQGALPRQAVDAAIRVREERLNQPYDAPHWAYDRAQRRFIEISDAPCRDRDGRPLPLPETILHGDPQGD